MFEQFERWVKDVTESLVDLGINADGRRLAGVVWQAIPEVRRLALRRNIELSLQNAKEVDELPDSPDTKRAKEAAGSPDFFVQTIIAAARRVLGGPEPRAQGV